MNTVYTIGWRNIGLQSVQKIVSYQLVLGKPMDLTRRVGCKKDILAIFFSFDT